MDTRTALKRDAVRAIGEARERAEALYFEGRRRGGNAVDALAGRRPPPPAPSWAALGIGMLVGAVAAVGLARLLRRRLGAAMGPAAAVRPPSESEVPVNSDVPVNPVLSDVPD
jgi:hypothetical protein